MNKLINISRSPQRNTFQKEKYIERCQKEGKEPHKDYLQMFEDDITRHESKFNEPGSRKDNMEYDLVSTKWILEKARNSDSYAQNLYAAMCNNEFTKNDVWPILTEKRWSCSWRYAGGIIADMLEKGDYIDWYCSGIKDHDANHPDLKNYVGEGHVTDEIRNDLFKLGWIVIDEDSVPV